MPYILRSCSQTPIRNIICTRLSTYQVPKDGAPSINLIGNHVDAILDAAGGLVHDVLDLGTSARRLRAHSAAQGVQASGHHSHADIARDLALGTLLFGGVLGLLSQVLELAQQFLLS